MWELEVEGIDGGEVRGLGGGSARRGSSNSCLYSRLSIARPSCVVLDFAKESPWILLVTRLDWPDLKA